MTHLSGTERALFVRRMFARIAPSYDKLNRIMTFRQDLKWRKEAAQALALSPESTLLDLGSGTGGMLVEVLQNYPESTIVGVDFTPEMIRFGRSRKDLKGVLWVIADVHNLPFPPAVFHGTISAFLMRNLPEVGATFQEQYRVLCNGGRLVCLETAPPPRNALHVLTNLYLTRVIPLLGGLISRDVE
ncbi:MAG: hypothetical protein A2Z14_03640, partial [Chloroflexi bacterium RBG_16_48_8]